MTNNSPPVLEGMGDYLTGLKALAERKLAEREAALNRQSENCGSSDSGPQESNSRKSEAQTWTATVDYVAGQKRIAELVNANQTGNLPGLDCPVCKNRGWFLRVREDGSRYTEECRCMTLRRNLQRIRLSGLEDMMKRYTFEAWQTQEPWQRAILKKAKTYAENPDGWFAVCGRSGTGKTHLCTAICGELLNRGMDVRYLLWRDTIPKLKAAVKEPEEYRRIMEPLKRVKCLYIDDLFKTGKGQAPTAADVNAAFELLNYRYNNRGLLTVLSSEMIIEEINAIDEAVGSRIYERTKERQNYFDLRGRRNWRLRDNG